MLLTNQQRFLLETLERLGCVRERQLAALLRQRFCRERPELAERITQSALRQLAAGFGGLRLEDGLVLPEGAVPDFARLEAIDVMLTITGCAPLDYEAPRPPLLLRFSVDGPHIQLFSVVEEARTDAVTALGRTERVVILLNGNEAARPLPFPNKQFFAKRQEDGQFKFFAARTS